MKVYNRKNFVHGLFMVLLGSALIPLGLLRGDLDWRDYILSGGLLLMGLVLLKNRSCAFQVVEYGCLVLETVFFVVGKITGEMLFVHMGCGLAVAIGLCLFADVATFMYYDSKL